ncbi:ankyrin repeat-containing domain protein [Aspergillus heterothallicus]
MSLSSLPTELLVQIFDLTDSLQTLHALAVTNRHFYALADPRLYQQDAQGYIFAIKWAATHGRIDLLRKSLKHGAQIPPIGAFSLLGEVAIRDSEGNTKSHTFPAPGSQTHPLRLAIENGHARIVDLLLDLGCDLKMKSHQRTSVLCLAVANGHADIVRILLARGATAAPTASCDKTHPIKLAALIGNQEILEILLGDSGNSGIATEKQLQRALEAAMLGEQLHLLPFLLERAFNSDFYFLTGQQRPLYSPLLWAAGKGHVDVARALLERGSDPDNPRGWDGLPPILVAVKESREEMMGNEGIARILLDNGAKPDYGHRDHNEMNKYNDGECRFGMGDELVPPLIAAVSRGYDSLVQLLVAHGANVNVEYSCHAPTTETNISNGFTGAPLLLAMELGYEEIAAFLREKGGREEAGTYEERMARWLPEEVRAMFMSWEYKRPGST